MVSGSENTIEIDVNRHPPSSRDGVGKKIELNEQQTFQKVFKVPNSIVYKLTKINGIHSCEIILKN